MKQAKNELFRIAGTNKDKWYQSVLLHIPHSSTEFPKDSDYSFNDLDDEERLLIDYFTNELFMPEKQTEQISSVVFPYCRLYCDVERLADDPLEKDGLGISYSRTTKQRGEQSFSKRAFSTLTQAFSIYADYHAEVSKQIVNAKELLLVDCHSFSALPNLLNRNPPDIDICIGYNEDKTYPGNNVIGLIADHFKSCGYKVGINTPFSNSKTFDVPVGYHSVMIEVNKRLYMNEQSLEKTSGFDKLKNVLQKLFTLLLE